MVVRNATNVDGTGSTPVGCSYDKNAGSLSWRFFVQKKNIFLFETKVVILYCILKQITCSTVIPVQIKKIGREQPSAVLVHVKNVANGTMNATSLLFLTCLL